MKKIGIIDYGVGNILSIIRAFEFLKADVYIIDKFSELSGINALILPGVGAFGTAIIELKKRRLDVLIKDNANAGMPILGICLGMQLLLDKGYEFGEYEGLGLIGGEVISIESLKKGNMAEKLPHVGWNCIHNSNISWQGTILEGIKNNSYVYFVHSYVAKTKDCLDTIAYTTYDDIELPVVIQKNNILGCQFHPEKSADTGLTILNNFLEYIV